MRAAVAHPWQKIRDYLALTKPRLLSLVLLSTAVGYIVVPGQQLNGRALFWTLVGTACSAGGSMTLNQWLERDRDALMRRTASRPLPAKRLSPQEALAFGIFLCAVGVSCLLFKVNGPASFFSLTTILTYLFLYTPLKPLTPYAVLMGAVPGALPPVVGWAGAAGGISWEAWTLFLIIFFWQMPHVLAISWMFRDEFRAAGFRMLTVVDAGGKRVSRSMVFYALLLIPVSLVPAWAGLTGNVYAAGALGLGGLYLGCALLCLKDLNRYARWLFRTSLVYLAFLLALMLMDKV